MKLRAISVLLGLILTAGCKMNSSSAEVFGGKGKLDGSYRFERNGWIYVHLEGPPDRVGYQHGYHLSEEVSDLLRNRHSRGKSFSIIVVSEGARIEGYPHFYDEDSTIKHRVGKIGEQLANCATSLIVGWPDCLWLAFLDTLDWPFVDARSSRDERTAAVQKRL